MYERPYTQIRKLFKDLNNQNKGLIKDVFEKSDSISLWILGLVLGAIAIIANDVGKVKTVLNPAFFHPLLYLLAISAATGIIYRFLYLMLYVQISQNYDAMDVELSNIETMSTQSNLTGNETYEELVAFVKVDFGEDFSSLIPFYHQNPQLQKDLYTRLQNHHSANIIFAEKDVNIAMDSVAGLYKKYFGVSRNKLFNGEEPSKKYMRWVFWTRIFLITYILSFIAALFLFVLAA